MSIEEIKSAEQTELERQTAEQERTLVVFKNIDKESFTHSYRGISITVAADHQLTTNTLEATHLAKHLARKILSRAKRKEVGLNKQDIAFKEEDVTSLMQTMLVPLEENSNTRNTLPKYTDTKQPDNEPVKEVSRKDVIKELETRGVKGDMAKSKEELLVQLLELEAQAK